MFPQAVSKATRPGLPIESSSTFAILRLTGPVRDLVGDRRPGAAFAVETASIAIWTRATRCGRQAGLRSSSCYRRDPPHRRPSQLGQADLIGDVDGILPHTEALMVGGPRTTAVFLRSGTYSYLFAPAPCHHILGIRCRTLLFALALGP